MHQDEILGFLHYLDNYGQPPVPLWAWEMAFWALVLPTTLLLRRLRPQWVLRVEDFFRRAGQHRAACVFGVILAVVAIRLLLLPVIAVPVPYVHDEFSYLLGGDTMAHGRLANPAHPMWKHLEAFHVNMQPAYQSMYPPGQGFALAIGERFFGHPWAGVVLSVALMCGALCWMLQGWMPPAWALLGGVIAVLRYGTFSYWINSYFGGAVAALGGALLIGALARLREKLTLGQLAVFMGGVFVLANSRPFEGLFFSLAPTAAMLWLLARSGLPRRRLWLRLVAPSLLMVAAGAAWMLYFNWRGTGDPLLMPYSLNHATYHISRPLLFQKPLPIPEYRHQEMRVFYVYHELPDVLRTRTPEGLTDILLLKWRCYYSGLLWPFLLLIVPGISLALRDCRMRVLVIALGLMAVALGAQIWPGHPHYGAPGVGAVLLILLNSLRQLRSSTPTNRSSLGTPERRPWALWLSRTVLLVWAVFLLVPLAERMWNPFSVTHESEGLEPRFDRQRLEAQLGRLPGRHLLIVHYRRGDVPSEDWIANDADIDKSKIVWARDMGEQANRELLACFNDRQVWYVDRRDGLMMPRPYAQRDLLTTVAPELMTIVASARAASNPTQPLLGNSAASAVTPGK